MGTPEVTGNYPSTIWSEVAEAGQADRTAALPAFGRIIENYQNPLLTYLIRRFSLQKDDAQEILQSFMLSKMVLENLLGKASQEKGRFRTFLVGALENFALSEWRKQHAQKRFPNGGFCSLEELPEGVAARLVEDFEESWTRDVLNRTIKLMKEECERSSGTDLWGIFEARLLLPVLEGCKPVPTKELAAKYNLKSESRVSKKCDAAKAMYRRLLREVVSEYAGGPKEVEEELRHLLRGLLK